MKVTSCIGVYGDGFLMDLVSSLDFAQELYPDNGIEFKEVFTIDGLAVCEAGEHSKLNRKDVE